MLIYLGMNYLIFDTIGDLVFGTPFGMLAAGKDTAPVAQDLNATMALYGSGITAAFTEFPAAKILEDRSAHSAHMGVLPAHWRPVARLLPWYREKNRRFQAFNRLTAMAIAKRLAGSEDRDDLLNKIRTAKDENVCLVGLFVCQQFLIWSPGSPARSRRINSGSGHTSSRWNSYNFDVSRLRNLNIKNH